MHFLLKIKNYFFYTFTFILFITCARQQPLGGGPKDEAPPVCIATYPQEEANTNFKGKYVELKFDKAIEVRNLHKELIITPKLKKIKNKPPYTEKKKKKINPYLFQQSSRIQHNLYPQLQKRYL